MPAQLTSPQSAPAHEAEPTVVSGELRCALTGRQLRPDEAYWAPPLVTAHQLIAAVLRTLLTAPGTLGQLLLGEQPNVPYAPEARQQLAARRTAEQLKLLVGILVAAALLIAPILLLAS
ncbi:MAG: hypothetical protein OHK0015_54360 [Chloroflexi bacterium OHK40]